MTTTAPKRPIYTIVFERGVGEHLVSGRSDKTVCGKWISAVWPMARGIVYGLDGEPNACPDCRRLTEPTALDAGLLERVHTELAFAEHRKYLAVPIDIADLKALLAAVGGAP